jgi:hypothetical protein
MRADNLQTEAQRCDDVSRGVYGTTMSAEAYTCDGGEKLAEILKGTITDRWPPSVSSTI